MIETVRQRQRNAFDFKSCYENLCALQGSCPLSIVTANLVDESVDCNADRISLQDWNPIFDATRINKNLKVIALKSYWQEKIKNGQPGNDESINYIQLQIPETIYMHTRSSKCYSDYILKCVLVHHAYTQYMIGNLLPVFSVCSYSYGVMCLPSYNNCQRYPIFYHKYIPN